MSDGAEAQILCSLIEKPRIVIPQLRREIGSMSANFLALIFNHLIVVAIQLGATIRVLRENKTVGSPIQGNLFRGKSASLGWGIGFNPPA